MPLILMSPMEFTDCTEEKSILKYLFVRKLFPSRNLTLPFVSENYSK